MKHFLNLNLSFVLNVATLSAVLIYSGVVFHNWGVAVENARPPYVLDFMAGVHNSERDDDRRALDGWLSLIRGSSYPADCPFKILYVIRRILKWKPLSFSSLNSIPLIPIVVNVCVPRTLLSFHWTDINLSYIRRENPTLNIQLNHLSLLFCFNRTLLFLWSKHALLSKIGSCSLFTNFDWAN